MGFFFTKFISFELLLRHSVFFLAEFGRIFIKLAGRLMLLSRLLLSVFILFAQAAVEKPL